jgi:hypothetical protein
MLKIALMNHAQTVTGIRGKVIPGARSSIVVVVKFSALNSPARQKTDALATHTFKP